MSSILLSNPFVAPPPASHAPSADPQTALAIPQAQGSAGASGAGDASAYSGSGSGHAGGSGQQALVSFFGAGGSVERPQDATPGSIVNAQARTGENPFGTNLPEVEMPDPLPTSPFLLAMRGG